MLEFVNMRLEENPETHEVTVWVVVQPQALLKQSLEHPNDDLRRESLHQEDTRKEIEKLEEMYEEASSSREVQFQELKEIWAEATRGEDPVELEEIVLPPGEVLKQVKLLVGEKDHLLQQLLDREEDLRNMNRGEPYGPGTAAEVAAMQKADEQPHLWEEEAALNETKETEVSVEGGKYKFTVHPTTGAVNVLRFGERWLEISQGGKAIIALIHACLDARGTALEREDSLDDLAEYLLETTTTAKGRYEEVVPEAIKRMEQLRLRGEEMVDLLKTPYKAFDPTDPCFVPEMRFTPEAVLGRETPDDGKNFYYRIRTVTPQSDPKEEGRGLERAEGLWVERKKWAEIVEKLGVPAHVGATRFVDRADWEKLLDAADRRPDYAERELAKLLMEATGASYRACSEVLRRKQNFRDAKEELTSK